MAGRPTARGLTWKTRLPVMAVVFACAFSPQASPGQPQPDDPANVEQLASQVEQIARAVDQLAEPSDLLDSLHFGWFDRPYARATLAILVKTTSILERELHLRRVGNEAISDERVRAMLTWCRRALAQVSSAEADDVFRPHRLRVTGEELARLSVMPALYSFVDTCTSTRHDDEHGDLDILAAIGMRLYPRLSRAIRSLAGDDPTIARANKLGMATIEVRTQGRHTLGSQALSVRASGQAAHHARRTAGNALLVQPKSLRDLLSGQARPPDQMEGAPAIPAIVDVVDGESWAASLARRAAARGATQLRRFVAAGWTPPRATGSQPNRLKEVVAAMWVHAFEGQSVGLVRGWRDLRDGSGSHYDSLLTDPAMLEAVAHAALDILRVGKRIRDLEGARDLAVVVDGSAIDDTAPNRWAAWIEPLWQGLADRQISFDVVPTNGRGSDVRGTYRQVVTVKRSDETRIDELLLGVQRQLGKQTDGRDVWRVLEDSGQPARGVWLRSGRDAQSRATIAIANLTDHPRRVRLSGRAVPREAIDVIADETVMLDGNPLALAPWQVRLLTATH